MSMSTGYRWSQIEQPDWRVTFAFNTKKEAEAFWKWVVINAPASVGGATLSNPQPTASIPGA